MNLYEIEQSILDCIDADTGEGREVRAMDEDKIDIPVKKINFTRITELSQEIRDLSNMLASKIEDLNRCSLMAADIFTVANLKSIHPNIDIVEIPDD